MTKSKPGQALHWYTCPMIKFSYNWLSPHCETVFCWKRNTLVWVCLFKMAQKQDNSVKPFKSTIVLYFSFKNTLSRSSKESCFLEGLFRNDLNTGGCNGFSFHRKLLGVCATVLTDQNNCEATRIGSVSKVVNYSLKMYLFIPQVVISY